jgi:hypothetical protein
MARSRSAMNLERDDEPIRGARLAPVRTVRRRLVSPSGREIVVDVPVYPPFRLPTEEERQSQAVSGRTNGRAGGSANGSAKGSASGSAREDDPEDDRDGDPVDDGAEPSAP